MHLLPLSLRDLLPLPDGANASDTVLGGVHFNRTLLDFWNYTLYSNNTLSNGSNCFLTQQPYTPVALLPNGSFVNSTWCYDPIRSIGPRAKAGVAIGVVYAVALMLILACLKKHGRQYLPTTKRFYPVGKRWQWYYAILVCVAAFISLFMTIDVDRFWVVGLPIIINSFFWYLLQQFTMALVWEANFFLIIPRNWGEIEKQRSPDQTAARAEPNATDVRFKVATFCLVICWLTIVASLRHSILHYYPRNRGVLNKARGFIRYTPLRFKLVIPLAACLIAYQGLVSFRWDYSVLNTQANLAAVYAGGYGPALLILCIQIAYGFMSPNEDKELMRQRRVREAEIDHDLGIVAKPAWWKRVTRDDHLVGKMSMRDRIARNVREVGGVRAPATQQQQQQQQQAYNDAPPEQQQQREIEMGNMGGSSSNASTPVRPGFDAAKGSTFSSYAGKSDRRRQERTMNAAAELLFPNSGAGRPDRASELMQDGPPPSYTDAQTRGRSDNASLNSLNPGERSNSTSTAVSVSGQPQQVKSMLDV
ncbi:Uncharacterized protein CGCA056_v006155 [Colletotrichum aenigma]|uniref:Uncharacterized protein n=1 Tax=Colletotrichum aenigma TaxID=1215731 RepID=UPI0018723373|nr:Uncharacterized protein CGCA056_v006155 [Colletotrichum aenigma]KAF5522040.1 Uncharacterized protein CGCA056_v006155 [Colletotrichum aenigma]